MTSIKTEKRDFAGSWPLMRRIIAGYMHGKWGRVWISLILMMVTAATTGAMARLMEPVVDEVFTTRNEQMIWQVAVAVFAVFAIRGFATYGHTVIMKALTQRIISELQRDLFAHLVHADTAFFHNQKSGSLQSRFITDMSLINTALIEGLSGLGKNSFTLAALIGVMFYQDWKLSLLSLFVFPLMGFVVALLGRKLRRVSRSMQEETGSLTAMLGQVFQANRHVKAYCAEDFEKERVKGTIERIYTLMCKSYRTSAIGTPLAEMMSGLAIVMIIVYGGYQVMEGATTAGKLFSFIAAFILAFEPMKRLTRLNNILQMGLAAMERLFEVMDMHPDIHDKDGAAALSTRHPVITFENVSFDYMDGTSALNQVSFVAEAGKTIALVGESGAGKSTILNLIPRFYDVTGGRVCIDGTDIRDVTLKSLRGHMALVSQDVSLFSDTVRENILYGRMDANEDEIIEAAKAAAAHDFIMELQDGYDTLLGENGVNLSGGQRQRIAIARAMLRNAPILLLDEATSALDNQSERMVQTALERLQQGRTTIVVAHRLTTIMNADMIYVMHEGRVVESGKHDDLIAQNGRYAHMHGLMEKEAV